MLHKKNPGPLWIGIFSILCFISISSEDSFLLLRGVFGNQLFEHSQRQLGILYHFF